MLTSCFLSVNLVPPPKPSVSVTSGSSVMLRWTLTSGDVQFVKVQYKLVGTGRPESEWQTVDEDLPASKQSFEVNDLQPGESTARSAYASVVGRRTVTEFFRNSVCRRVVYTETD